MPNLTAEEIADLVVTTSKDLGRMRFTEIATDLQDHVAMSRLIRKNKVKFDSGLAIQFQVLTDSDNNSRNTGLFDVDNTNQEDALTTGSVPWRHTVASWAFDRRQLSMNRGRSKIVDFVKTKRTMSLISLAELMEGNFWGEPTASTDDTTPFGLKYWAVYSATEGFNGANNSNFSSGPGGISRTTYPRWKNYTFNYTDVSKADMVRKARRARAFTGFKPPITNMPVRDYSRGHRYGIYTTYDTLATMEELLEAQNDALGNDVASKDGRTLMGSIPVEWVPYLQANEPTADPIVGIDWGVFSPVFLRGEYLREDPPSKKGDSHNVMEAFTDLTYNFVCHDCRRLWLGAKSTWH